MDTGLGFWSIATLIFGVPLHTWFVFSKITRYTPAQLNMTWKEFFRAKRLEDAAKKGDAAVQEILDEDPDNQNTINGAGIAIGWVFLVLITLFRITFYLWMSGFFLFAASGNESMPFKAMYFAIALACVISLVLSVRSTWKAFPVLDKKVHQSPLATIIFGRTLDALALIGLLIYGYLAIFG